MKQTLSIGDKGDDFDWIREEFWIDITVLSLIFGTHLNGVGSYSNI